MKTLFTFLFLAVTIITQATATETLLKINHNGSQQVQVYQTTPSTFYLGNNLLMTATVCHQYNLDDGSFSYPFKIVVSNLNGTTVMNTRVTIDSFGYNATILAAGKLATGGYYLYTAVNGLDSMGMSVTMLTLIKLANDGSIAGTTRVNMPDYAFNNMPCRVLVNTAGDFYINGNADHAMTIYKINAAGTVAWGRTFTFDSSGKNPAPDLELNGDSGIIVAGSASEIANAFIALDNSGNVQWATSYNTGNVCIPYAIKATADGNFITGGATFPGAFLWKIDSHGNVLWRKTYSYGEISALVEMNDGTFFALFSNYPAGNLYPLMLHLDAQGNILEKKNLLTTLSTGFGPLQKEGNEFTLPVAVTFPADNSIYSMLIKASSLNDLCETTNTPITAADDAGAPLVATNATASLGITILHSDEQVTAIADKNVTYTASVFNFCSYMTDVEEVPTGEEISVFPIPASDMLNVQLGSSFTGTSALKVYDTNGSLLTYQPVTGRQTSLPVSLFAKGIYVLQVYNNITGKTFTRRFVVIK